MQANGSIHPALVFAEDGGDVGEEVQGFQLLDGAAFAGSAHQAEPVTVGVPADDLVETRLFEFVGQRRLAGASGSAGQDIAARECYPAFLTRCAQRACQFHEAFFGTEEVNDVRLHDPTVDLVGFEVKGADGLDRISIQGEIHLVGAELEGCAYGPVEEAIALKRESATRVFDQSGQECVVVHVE